jgi:hypothetical protein
MAAAVEEAYGKKHSPVTNHNIGTFEVLKAYGMPHRAQRRSPRRSRSRRRRSASNENIYKSPKNSYSPRSKSVSRKRRSSRKRSPSPRGKLGALLNQPQILQALLAGLHSNENRNALPSLFPNAAGIKISNKMKAFPMKSRYEFRVGLLRYDNRHKMQGAYRPVTMADINNDTFRKHLAHSGPWELLQTPIKCNTGLWIADGLLMVNKAIIMPATPMGAKQELFAPYMPMNYTTKIPWNQQLPSLARSAWTFNDVPVFGPIPCLFVKEA